MANVEQISQVAMQVITYAGMAKSNYLEALKYYREKDQTAYEQSMSNGDVSFSQAHEAHLQLLQQEMNTQEPQITMLMGACGRSAYVSRNNKDFDSRNNFINRK